MKEENRVLRKVVEQTMKDYHDLQMKLSTIHQNNQEKVNPGSLFVEYLSSKKKKIKRKKKKNSSKKNLSSNVLCIKYVTFLPFALI